MINYVVERLEIFAHGRPFPTYTPIGPQPEFAPLPSLAETEPGFAEYFEAQAGNALRDNPT